MKNLLLLLLITFALDSCSKGAEIIDRVEKKWTLERTEGNTQGLQISSQWQKMEIKDGDFTLFINETVDEKIVESQVASGKIEVCEDMMMHNCYTFIVESKNPDKQILLENVGRKIVTYLNDELSLTGICCDEVSYFLQ